MGETFKEGGKEIDILEILGIHIKGLPRDTGFLHCSTHLSDIDLHNVMDFYKFDRVEDTYGDYVRVTTGTLWHEYLGNVLSNRGDLEIDVTNGLPSGWSGTADLIYDGYLIDIKTTTKEKMNWLSHPKSTPLDKYIWQVSAYYHALENMGHWLKGAYILYIPIDGGEFLLKEVEVLPKQMVWDMMADKKHAVDTYAENGILPDHPGYSYKLTTVKSRKIHELYQIPPVYASWCKFKDCPCQGMEKKIVASLTFKDVYDGDAVYETTLRGLL